MSGSPTPVYDSVSKKCEVTRRRIFKDNNGKYKEKLEIKNREKRTLFGSIPFEGSSNWKLDDLSDINEDEPNISQGEKVQKGSTGNVFKQRKSSDNPHCDTKTMECGFQSTLRKIIEKLKDDRSNDVQQDLQGVKKIFEKSRDNGSHGHFNDIAVSNSRRS